MPIPKSQTEGVVNMQIQALQGYFNNGHFYHEGRKVTLPERKTVIINILEFPTPSSLAGDTANEEALDNETVRRVAALDKFFTEIESCDEPVPEFEKIRLREYAQ